jgi:hypothetical protein
LQDALSPSAARRVVAAIVQNPRGGESRVPASLESPSPARRPESPPSVDRRPRATPAPAPREETVPAAVMRRRRAFAFLGAHRPLGDKL